MFNMRSGFASFDQMVPVNNWPQVIDQFDQLALHE
jgi:hypothetical protein